MYSKKLTAKQRKNLILIFCVLSVGIAYYAFTKITNMYIPCPFRLVTGFVCPGCGISHFLSDIISLNFKNAVQQNLAISILIPIWIVCSLIFLFSKSDSVKKRLFTCIAWGSIAFLLIFGVVRNLPAFSFLLPLYTR